MNKVLTVFVVVVFLFTVVVPFLTVEAQQAAKEVKGSVTKIEGKKLTIKQADGKEVTVEVKDVKDIKVGDSVVVKDGVVTKEVKKKKAVEGC